MSYYLCGYMSSLQKNEEEEEQKKKKQFGAPCGKTATFIWSHLRASYILSTEVKILSRNDDIFSPVLKIKLARNVTK